MKQVDSSQYAWSKETCALRPMQNNVPTRKTTLFGVALICCLVLSTSCKKAMWGNDTGFDLQQQQKEVEYTILNKNPSLLPQAVRELKQARTATARYQNINNALADGYADIDVVRENMGYHFLKATLLDNHFDPTKPEILVYNKKHNGRQELVALEYAIPINLTSGNAPEGFTGTADVWKRDTDFGLWLLHAWVWTYNPSGVFNPTNPLVHLH